MPEDTNRRFILSYFLSDDTIGIYEPPVRNSGIQGGKYLKRTKVTKPGSTPENPIYYEPSDFTIGSTIEGKIQPGFVILFSDVSFIAWAVHISSFTWKICCFWVSSHLSFQISSWCTLIQVCYCQCLNLWISEIILNSRSETSSRAGSKLSPATGEESCSLLDEEITLTHAKTQVTLFF